MVIKRLKLNNFGRFNNREIELTDGINLIYGENESGKTTVFSFIRAMLFGLERSRGKAAKNDVYSKYEPWQNQSFYEGVMVFESGNKRFRIERSFSRAFRRELLINEIDGEELSIEHGDLSNILYGLNDNIFNNTMAIGQLNKATDGSLADELKNYTAGFSMSGDGGVNVSNALERLKKQRKALELQKNTVLEKQREKNAVLLSEREYINSELQRKQEQYEDYKGQYKTAEKNVKIEQKLLKKRLGIKNLMLSIVMAAVFAVLVFILKPLYLKVVLIAIACILIIFYNKFSADFTEKEIKKLYSTDDILNNLKGKLQNIGGDIKDKRVMLSNIDDRAEEINCDNEREQRLSLEIAAVNKAYNTIQDLSLRLQRETEENLNSSASKVLSKITDYKYSDIKIDDKLNLRLNTDTKLINTSQLSNGTVDEIYFSVRMAFLDLFFKEEKMPVILDEAFVMYDEKRLINTLKYLYESDRQVIILTCHKREEELLRELGCQFNLVYL